MWEYYINYWIIKDFEVYIDFSKKEYFQIEYNLKKIINFINNNSENIYKKIVTDNNGCNINFFNGFVGN